MGKQMLNTEKADEIKDTLLDVILKSNELLDNSPDMSDEGRKAIVEIRAATAKCWSDLQELPEDNADGWIQALETVFAEIGKALFNACLRNIAEIEFADVVKILNKITDLL